MRWKAALIATAGLASMANASPLYDYNLIVFDDVIGATSQVDGRTIIGGNLISPNAANFATGSSMGPFNSGYYGLQVGGNLDAQINVNNGANVRVGGNVDRNVSLNGGGTLYLGGSVKPGAHVNGGPTAGITPGQITADVAIMRSELEATSATLAGLAANSFEEKNGKLVANPDSQGVAVFQFDASRFNGKSSDMNLNINGATTVIINVAGANLTLAAPPNLNGGFNKGNSSKILWNFYDAQNIDMRTPWDGAVLAPFANLDMDNASGINGSVAVRQLSNLDGAIRGNLYTGIAPIPTPASASLLAGVGLVACRRRRRRNAS